MKNLTKRTKGALSILFYLGFTLFINSCNDDDTPPDCGCESEIQSTISESVNLVGKMFYKTQDDPRDTYYNNHFWIVYPPDESYVHSKIIVCNEDISGNEFDGIIESGERVEVKFSGYRKEVCEKAFAPSIYNYERIVLTSIQRQ